MSYHMDKFKKGVILEDESALQAISNASSTETKELCKIIYNLQFISTHTVLQWIPSYCNITGND